MLKTKEDQRNACEHPITRAEFSYMRSEIFMKTCMLCGIEIKKV